MQITPADNGDNAPVGYCQAASVESSDMLFPRNQARPHAAPYGCCHHLKMSAAALDGYRYVNVKEV